MTNITEKTWKEFREVGMLWFINRMLHIFGWAIVFEYDDNTEELKRVHPARVTFRGFAENVEDDGFKHVTKYVKDHAEEMLAEVEKE